MHTGGHHLSAGMQFSNVHQSCKIKRSPLDLHEKMIAFKNRPMNHKYCCVQSVPSRLLH